MRNKDDNKNKKYTGKFAIIPGGSKGIGKCIAKEIVKQGGSVCVIARTVEPLKETVAELNAVKSSEDQFIEMIACDTTDMDKLKPLLTDLIKKRGVPHYLFNCVGYAYPQYIEKLTLEDFKKNMDVNYLGQLVPILILLPFFMEKKQGHIINISSEAGFIGLMGYSTYSPTKFALVGLSECLRHELKPYNINISVVYPVDTNTPGFEIENKTKPEELKVISARAKLMEPDEVAKIVVKKVLKNKFNILPGESGFHYWAKRHLPWLVFSEMDNDLKKARKSMGK